MLSESSLLTLTRQTMPDWPEPSRLHAILKGGSDRNYFRVDFQDDAHPPVILMNYTLARPDNPRFVPATRRLEALGVRVPHIFAHDTDTLCVWLEDLGRTDLHAFRTEPWEVREPLYQAALAEAAKLHAVDAGLLSAADLSEMELCFDEKLYEWEQNYFLTHYVNGLRGVTTDTPEFNEAHETLASLRRVLADMPRCLVHRDFQSQNILLQDGRAWLIDYQGVRPGLAEYDLASLLLDPYVDLTDPERDALLKWYADHTMRELMGLREKYLLAAAQRLMQAVGAYANLSRNLGKPHFEDYIPIAIERLRAVFEGHPSLAPLTKLIP